MGGVSIQSSSTWSSSFGWDLTSIGVGRSSPYILRYLAFVRSLSFIRSSGQGENSASCNSIDLVNSFPRDAALLFCFGIAIRGRSLSDMSKDMEFPTISLKYGNWDRKISMSVKDVSFLRDRNRASGKQLSQGSSVVVFPRHAQRKTSSMA